MDYIPVPSAAAEKLAKEFDKQVVVILTIDVVRKMMHVATYGETDAAKLLAAKIGTRCVEVCGGDLEKATIVEQLQEENARLKKEQAADTRRLDGIQKYISDGYGLVNIGIDDSGYYTTLVNDSEDSSYGGTDVRTAIDRAIEGR